MSGIIKKFIKAVKKYGPIRLIKMVLYSAFLSYNRRPAQISSDAQRRLMRIDGYRRLSQSRKKEACAVFDTAAGSKNKGDFIIMDYCNQILDEILADVPKTHISTHVGNKARSNLAVRYARYKILCGSNILSSAMDTSGGWDIYTNDYANYFDLCLLGVGWNNYEADPNAFTQDILKSLLSKTWIHSVRDSYTECKLKALGFDNVLNTACPTMWKLTPEHCALIPQTKAKIVLTTVTDYRKDFVQDQSMFEILLKSYETVFVWIQGNDDFDYLSKLGIIDKVTCLDYSLEELDQFILSSKPLDFVGTRLHAGIRALNHKCRSIIIGIDNRSVEISKDTKLMVLDRKSVQNQLYDLIHSSFETQIVLPQTNIDRWKKQFLKS